MCEIESMQNRNEYEILGAAVRTLMQKFRERLSLKPDQTLLVKQMKTVLDLAAQIGDPLLDKAKALQGRFALCLKHPEKQEFIERFLQEVLQFERETREI